MKNHVTLLVLAVLASVALTGCSSVSGVIPDTPGSASNPSTVYTTSEFWDNYRKSAALEVNPAESLDELRERSEQIVMGRVTGAQSGPSYPVVLDDDTTDENGTTILTIKVEKVLAGPAAEEVKVWISNASRDLNSAPSEMMPVDSLIWFLRPSEKPGIMYATTRDGIIGTTDEGKPTTMLLGTLGEELIPAGISPIEQLAAAVSESTKPASN